MVRIARALAPLTAIVLAPFAVPSPAAADATLQRLHVSAFTFGADTTHPVMERPFDLLITVRLSDRVRDLRNLILPTFIGLEPLGDERSLIRVPGGTEYRERITVIAHRGGTLRIAPPYLDAVDARDGLPKRFLANPLVLTIGGPAEMLRGDGTSASRNVFGVILRAAGWVLFLALAGLLLLRRMIRARRGEPAEPEREREREFSPHDRLRALRDVLDVLAEHPSRAAVFAVRTQLRAWAGIPAEATLIDALAHIHEREGPLRSALIAVERAAFCKDDLLEDAVRDAVAAVERLVR